MGLISLCLQYIIQIYMNNTVCNKIRISSWNVRGLADKIDYNFLQKRLKVILIYYLKHGKGIVKKHKFQVTFPFQQ